MTNTMHKTYGSIPRIIKTGQQHITVQKKASDTLLTLCHMLDVNHICYYTYYYVWSISVAKDFAEVWFKGKGRFYVFSTDAKNWNSSRERCQALGGDLVIINSKEEQV